MSRPANHPLFDSGITVQEALLLLLFECGGEANALWAEDTYKPLAGFFGLSEHARSVTRRAYLPSKWTQAPIGVRDIALLVLASKGIPAARDAIVATLHGARKTVGSLTRRGITRKVGRGKATRYALWAEG